MWRSFITDHHKLFAKTMTVTITVMVSRTASSPLMTGMFSSLTRNFTTLIHSKSFAIHIWLLSDFECSVSVVFLAIFNELETQHSIHPSMQSNRNRRADVLDLTHCRACDQER